MAHNVRVLGEEADLKAESFSLAQMPIESTNVQFNTKPAFLPNTCYVRLWVFKIKRDGKRKSKNTIWKVQR